MSDQHQLAVNVMDAVTRNRDFLEGIADKIDSGADFTEDEAEHASMILDAVFGDEEVDPADVEAGLKIMEGLKQ